MNKDQRFFTVLRSWLVKSTELVDAMLDHPVIIGNGNGQAAPARAKARKTIAGMKKVGPANGGQTMHHKRKYTKKSEFWQKVHPRKKVSISGNAA